jgi:uncharacterized membrane protein YcgQ (UPF0703/DUF1980 family)
MKKENPKNYLLIALLCLLATLSFFLVNYYRTQKKLEDFKSVTGKEEKTGSALVIDALLKDNQIGTFDERVRYENAAPQKKVIEIKEKMFIAQTNDVYLNSADYLGKSIKLEGLFKLEQYTGDDALRCYVLRYGPGCCGSDGNAGFEVAWDGNWTLPPQYPAVDEWVQASGTLKTYEEDGWPYLYLALSSLEVLDKRGAEFVTQ